MFVQDSFKGPQRCCKDQILISQEEDFARLFTRERTADGMVASAACLLVRNYLFTGLFNCVTDRPTD